MTTSDDGVTEKPDQWRRRYDDFDVSHLVSLAPEDMARRLRDHVMSRGGPTMNDQGEVALPNGGWMLMLGAAAQLSAMTARALAAEVALEAMRKEPTAEEAVGMALVSCPDCRGSGFVSVPLCCCNFTPSGECCTEPVEGRAKCEACLGEGVINSTDALAARGK